MQNDKIKLGDRVKDRITGYSGVAIGITEWIHGCRRISVQSEKLKDGAPGEAHAFDEVQLEIVKAAVMKIGNAAPEAAIPTGGPITMPRRRPDATR